MCSVNASFFFSVPVITSIPQLILSKQYCGQKSANLTLVRHKRLILRLVNNRECSSTQVRTTLGMMNQF